MKTAILGAGALGAMYGAHISAAGYEVSFVASGQRAERLRRGGLIVNGTPYQVAVVDPFGGADGGAGGTHLGHDDPTAAFDLVMVALKHDQLPEALPALLRVVDAHTTVISVMNGIDSEYQISEAMRTARPGTGSKAMDSKPSLDERVLLCMVAGMDAVRDGSSVAYSQMGTLFVGRPRNPDGGASDDRVRALQAFLSDAAVSCKTPENMEHAIWNKFMLNVGINQWSAVLGAPYGIFHRCEDARELMRSAMREVQAVARARGIDLSDDDREHWFAIVNTLGAEGKTSMLQDVEAGRPTEVEMFAGRMVTLGRELGITTPVNEVLLHAIRAVEAERLRAMIAAE